MRYGLVREIDGHAPVAIERRRLEGAGCDVLLEEGPPTRAALRAQRTLLYSLKPGDELLVCSLDTLQMSTGQLVLLLRRFDQQRVALRIVGDEGVTTLTVSGQVRTLLAHLAANEARRPDPTGPPARSRPRGRPLSRYQIDYANELRRHGASLRTIGQLFQTSPADLARQLDPPAAEPSGAEPPRAEPKAPQVVISLPERRARRS